MLESKSRKSLRGKDKNKRKIRELKKQHEQWAKKKSRVAPEENAYSSAGIKTLSLGTRDRKANSGTFPRLSKGAERASKHQHPPGSPKEAPHEFLAPHESSLKKRIFNLGSQRFHQVPWHRHSQLKKKKIIKHTRKHPPWERSSRSKKQKYSDPKEFIYLQRKCKRS